MRYDRTCLAVLCLLLMLTASLAASPVKQPQQPGMTPAELARQVTVASHSVMMTSNLSLDKQGQPAGMIRQLQVQIGFHFDETRQLPLRFSATRFKHGRTDVGESLRPLGKANEFPWDSREDWYDFDHRPWAKKMVDAEMEGILEAGQRDVYQRIKLEIPSDTSRKIEELSGEAEIIYATGKPVEVFLSPYREQLDRKIELAQVPGLSIQFSLGATGGLLQIEIPKGKSIHFAGIEYVDGQGRRVPSVDVWMMTMDDKVERHTVYLQGMPDDGGIRLLLNTRLETVVIPFTLRDIPLVTPRRGE